MPVSLIASWIDSENSHRETLTPYVIVLPPMDPMSTSYSVYEIFKGRLIGFW